MIEPTIHLIRRIASLGSLPVHSLACEDDRLLVLSKSGIVFCFFDREQGQEQRQEEGREHDVLLGTTARAETGGNGVKVGPQGEVLDEKVQMSNARAVVAASPLAFESGLLPRWLRSRGGSSQVRRTSLGRNWGRQTLVGRPVLDSGELALSLTSSHVNLTGSLHLNAGSLAPQHVEDITGSSTTHHLVDITTGTLVSEAALHKRTTPPPTQSCGSHTSAKPLIEQPGGGLPDISEDPVKRLEFSDLQEVQLEDRDQIQNEREDHQNSQVDLPSLLPSHGGNKTQQENKANKLGNPNPFLAGRNSREGNSNERGESSTMSCAETAGLIRNGSKELKSRDAQGSKEDPVLGPQHNSATVLSPGGATTSTATRGYNSTVARPSSKSTLQVLAVADGLRNLVRDADQLLTCEDPDVVAGLLTCLEEAENLKKKLYPPHPVLQGFFNLCRDRDIVDKEQS
ncbi:unnamed protein product [Amoebophrya sp. A25]|nr:unnamed protein product [Amoebophrya sp. A25]|eukprot:GSA25T00024472001.1